MFSPTAYAFPTSEKQQSCAAIDFHLIWRENEKIGLINTSIREWGFVENYSHWTPLTIDSRLTPKYTTVNRLIVDRLIVVASLSVIPAHFLRCFGADICKRAQFSMFKRTPMKRDYKSLTEGSWWYQAFAVILCNLPSNTRFLSWFFAHFHL